MIRPYIATPDYADVLQTRIYYRLLLSAHDFLVWVDLSQPFGIRHSN